MSQNPRIDSVMTKVPHTIDIDASLREAEDRMIDHEIRHLPVMDGKDLVGLLSDRDMAFASSDSAQGLGEQMKVRDVCSLDVYTVDPGASLGTVAAEMAARRLGSVVITDNGQVVGLFTATDACRSLADLLAEEGGAA